MRNFLLNRIEAMSCKTLLWIKALWVLKLVLVKDLLKAQQWVKHRESNHLVPPKILESIDTDF